MVKINNRQQLILNEIDENTFVKVNDLSEKYNVSFVTIRKDLQFLENLGLLYRTHGGASKDSSYVVERNINEKEFVQVSQKQKIAKAALKFIKENDYIVLGSGTTVYYLAKVMPEFEKLVVVSAALRVCMELTKYSSMEILQLGGNIRKSSISVIGSEPEEELKKLSFNKLFLGVDGIDLSFGLSTSNSSEASLNRVMIEQSEKVIVLADSTKINKKGFGKICDIDKVDVLITYADIRESDRLSFEEIGINVVIAR